MTNELLDHSFVATKNLVKRDNDIRVLREKISYLETEQKKNFK